MTTSTPSVFLDIGAHSGETLVVAQHRRWGFDHVHCFEPASSCVAALRRLVTDDSRVTIHPVALWDRAGELTLHGAGAVGASLFDDKPTPDRATVSETVPTVDTASHLDALLPPEVDITVKINVEGAELEILHGLRDLLAGAGGGRRLRSLLVHVDADKIPGHGDRAAKVRSVLTELGGSAVEDAPFFGPTVEAKTTRWLRSISTGPVGRAWIRTVERGVFTARLAAWQHRRKLSRA